MRNFKRLKTFALGFAPSPLLTVDVNDNAPPIVSQGLISSKKTI